MTAARNGQDGFIKIVDKETGSLIVEMQTKRAKTNGKQSKIDFTGPAVSLSGTLKFGGAGPVGPLRKMTKKRPDYGLYFQPN